MTRIRLTRIRLTRIRLIGAVVFACGAAAPAVAHAQSGGKGPVVLTVENARRELIKIAVPKLLGDGEPARTIAEIVSGDLMVSSWFKVLDPQSFVANLAAEGTGIVVGDWRNVGAQAVSKGKVSLAGGTLNVEFRLYELGKGAEPVLSRDFTGPAERLRAVAHMWSNDIVRHFTGENGFFDTQIAFSGGGAGGRRDIHVMDYDGANLHRVTDNGSQNLLPAWSPAGDRIVFTSYLRGNPDLYVVTPAGGRARRISERPGLNLGAAFNPDGTRIACTLSHEGNAEIYLLGGDGTVMRRVTNAPTSIDTSPAWSPDGGTLAFVSNRQGSPQIFTLDIAGSTPKRLTMQGTYNQEPAWCPKCATPTVAFTARDEKSRFDVFTIDVASRQLVRLTENQGDNQHPTWAPNGRALAFASSRGGIWVVTADGKTQRQVYRGAAATPAWGPAHK